MDAVCEILTSLHNEKKQGRFFVQNCEELHSQEELAHWTVDATAEIYACC